MRNLNDAPPRIVPQHHTFPDSSARLGGRANFFRQDGRFFEAGRAKSLWAVGKHLPDLCMGCLYKNENVGLLEDCTIVSITGSSSATSTGKTAISNVAEGGGGGDSGKKGLLQGCVGVYFHTVNPASPPHFPSPTEQQQPWSARDRPQKGGLDLGLWSFWRHISISLSDVMICSDANSPCTTRFWGNAKTAAWASTCGNRWIARL
jgi:hypothetical protein